MAFKGTKKQLDRLLFLRGKEKDQLLTEAQAKEKEKLEVLTLDETPELTKEFEAPKADSKK